LTLTDEDSIPLDEIPVLVTLYIECAANLSW